MDSDVTHLTERPIPTLIRQIAIPASIGFFFNTMFNVEDTVFAGLWSTQALAALALSFPIFFIIIAIGSGLSTGSTALIANAMGAGKRDHARRYALQTVTASIILSVILMSIGLAASPALFRLLGASNEYLALSLSFMNVIFYGTVFFMLNYAFNSALNAAGNTKTFRNFLIAGFFLNGLLDPWFMFGWLGFPRLGVPGVALATVVVQAGGCVYMGWSASRHHLIGRFAWGDFLPHKETLLAIAGQGLPASLNALTIGIGIFVITWFLSPFGQVQIAAYGIATRIEQIFLLPTIGLTIAALALSGHNNGAGKPDRVRETYAVCMRYGLLIMTVATILLFLLARYWMLIFTREPAVIAAGVVYLHIAALITWAYASLFTSVSVLQGLKKPAYPVWIGLYRQIVGPLLIYALGTRFFGVLGLWWGIFGVTWSATLITLWYTRRTLGTT